MNTKHLMEIEARAERLSLTSAPHEFCQCACHADTLADDVSAIGPETREACAEVWRLVEVLRKIASGLGDAAWHEKTARDAVREYAP